MAKSLRRSERHKILFGVCGGLAEHFNIDPTLVRLAFVIGALLGGPGIVIYLVAALLMPSGTALPASSQRALPR